MGSNTLAYNPELKGFSESLSSNSITQNRKNKFYQPVMVQGISHNHKGKRTRSEYGEMEKTLEL